MSREAVITKMRKLWALAESTQSPEGIVAKAFYERLQRQYQVSPTEIESEPVREFKIKIPKGMQDTLVRIASYLDLKVYSFKGKNKYILLVKATKSDFDLLSEFFKYTKQAIDQYKRELNHQLVSFVAGHVNNCYPQPNRARKCPSCNQQTFMNQGDRMVCTACGHRSRKFKVLEVDGLAYRRGAAVKVQRLLSCSDVS